MCLAAIVFLTFEITAELRFLGSADSDNVHWTLSQAEVEFLELGNAIDHARVSGGSRLDQVVEEFDIFYSRMVTLSSGQLYAQLRLDPGFAGPVNTVRAQLDAMIPLIDGPPEALWAGLDEMATQLEALRLQVRNFSTAGLQHFARSSDESRTSIAVILQRLALVTAALLLALAVLLLHSRRIMARTSRREKELGFAYARLNTILETSLDAVIVAGMDGRILDFNSAAERIFKTESAAVRGKSIGEVMVPEHLRAAHEAGMDRMRTGGEMHVVGQGRVKLEAMRTTGEVFPIELAIERATTEEGDLAVAFVRDISRRVASENELVQARDRALAGEKAKAEFLAMMTHEIRTPLNGVLGNLSLLNDTPLDTAQSRYVRNMGISGKLLMQHVDAVLDVARFESGVETGREETVHIGQLIQDIVDSQSITAQANGNRLTWAWSDRPVEWVRVDASRLQQVLVNLVGNAIKFTRDGQIMIEAEAHEGADGLRLDLRVIDTGIGIAPDDQARIFDDFQTVSEAQSKSINGTGLGLSIARRFITAMQGEIGLESTPGEGSVFWLQIPVTAQEAPGMPEAQAAFVPTTDLPPLDVLLVEDDDINLEIAQEMLGRMHHVVTPARNGQQAVEIATARRFDLILMDIRMPVLDGLEATRRIRASGGKSADVPVIAFSANVLPEAKERFAAAGMSGFLGKPLKGAELSELIATFFARETSAQSPPPDAAPDASAHAPPASPGRFDTLAARHSAELVVFFDDISRASMDRAEIAERAHKLAGSAAAFGQHDLRAALVHVETTAEAAADTDGLQAALTAARLAWQNAPAPHIG
ncbi:response regulator [Rhodobacteraceae bacterium]|nr:response regulator [Paracoccaceae bacterium]